jgi:hypothetical protein
MMPNTDYMSQETGLKGPRIRSEASGRSKSAVHEAARLVFCVYFGIPVLEVRVTDSYFAVRFETDSAFRNAHALRSTLQMIMSGAITVQTVMGEENSLFETAILEAHQLFELVMSSSMSNIDLEFDDVLTKSCKHAVAHLADPKMRAAISSVTRILIRERSDVRGDMLDHLLTNARAKLST